MAMARRGRRPGTSRAVTVAVPAIATNRPKRQCRNITPTSIAVLNHERPSLPATPSSDCGSSYVLDENLDSVAHLSSDKDAGSPADAETDKSRDSGTDMDGERGVRPGSKADAILKRIAYHKKQGPAKPRHSERTTELWKTESGFWKRQASQKSFDTLEADIFQILPHGPGRDRAVSRGSIAQSRPSNFQDVSGMANGGIPNQEGECNRCLLEKALYVLQPRCRPCNGK
jgi:hypothetical protein